MVQMDATAMARQCVGKPDAMPILSMARSAELGEALPTFTLTLSLDLAGIMLCVAKTRSARLLLHLPIFFNYAFSERARFFGKPDIEADVFM